LSREDPEVFAAKYANRTLPSEERKWFGEISASGKIGAYKRRFLEFAEANKGRKKGSVNSICFVIDLKRSMDDSEKSYDIVLQKDGYTLKQNFTPPGKIDINIIKTLKRGLTDHTVLVTHEAMQDFKAELEINLEPYEPREEQANKHFYVPIGDNSKQTTVEFKDLTRWTLYKARFRVWMLIDGVKFGSGSESDLLWFNTLPTSPPSALICQPIISSKSYGLSFNWKKPITIADRVNVDNYQYVMSKDGEEVASGETGDFSLINDSLEPDTTYTFSIKVKGDSLPYTLLETPNNNVTINTALESLPVTKKCKTQGLIPVEALTPEEVQKRVLKTIGQLDAKVDSFSKDLKRESDSLRTTMADLDNDLREELKSDISQVLSSESDFLRTTMADLDNDLREELKGAAFDVFRTEDWKSDGIVTYTRSEVNTFGGAMNLGTGKFRAPDSGIYRFTFTARFYTPSGNDGRGDIHLKKDGTTIATSYENPPGSDGNGYTTISLNSITELSAGQSVWVEWDGDYGAYLDENSAGPFTHFTGEIITRL